MEKFPFALSESNPRLVKNVERSNQVYMATAGLWLVSMYMYNRRYFRKDGNPLNMMAFAAASIPAAYGFADLARGSSLTEAALMNNAKEQNSA